MYKVFYFGEDCKPHVMRVSGAGTEAVIKDLLDRGHPLTSCENTDITNLDYPGMVLMNRPWSTFELENLTVEIACENVGPFFRSMAKLKDRGGYYKIHSWHHCLVLDPTQFYILLGRIETGLAEAEARDTEFYNAWKAKHGRRS